MYPSWSATLWKINDKDSLSSHADKDEMVIQPRVSTAYILDNSTAQLALRITNCLSASPPGTRTMSPQVPNDKGITVSTFVVGVRQRVMVDLTLSNHGRESICDRFRRFLQDCQHERSKIDRITKQILIPANCWPRLHPTAEWGSPARLR
jgi:hypothetical protein